MPYNDPEAKRAWELKHRTERLARRRELRQVETAWRAAHPGAVRLRGTAAGFLLPLIVGVLL